MNSLYSLAEKLKTAADYIDLTDSNFINNGFIYPVELLNATFQTYINKRSYNPDPKGLLPARESISQYYKSESCAIDPDNIILTASTSESYNLLFSTLTKPGDEILLPNPTYPLFEYLAKFNHLKIKSYQLDPTNNWQIDIAALKTKVTPKTKFIVLISPNNPTGSILNKSDIDFLIEICNQNKIDIIFDEVFNIFVNEDQKHLRPENNNLEFSIFVLNGISKMLALADLKLAWIAGYGKNINQKIDALETTNDTFLNANYFIQSALPELLAQAKPFQESMQETIANNRQIVTTHFSYPNRFIFNPPQGGIHALIGIKNQKNSEDEFCLNLLKQKHVLVHPAYFYDFKFKPSSTIGFVMSYLLPEEKLKQALNHLTNLLS